MKCRFYPILTAMTLFLSGCVSYGSEDPSVVPQVDLSRYAGFWYEIGHNPNFFQGKCERSTAEYGLLPNGKVSVKNTCYRDSKVYGTIEGTASVVNASEPAKLKVDFGFFRRGSYWIVALDPDYQWAVVSGPGKSSLFILARKAPMDASLLREILSDLDARGFDTSRIIYDKY